MTAAVAYETVAKLRNNSRAPSVLLCVFIIIFFLHLFIFLSVRREIKSVHYIILSFIPSSWIPFFFLRRLIYACRTNRYRHRLSVYTF